MCVIDRKYTLRILYGNNKRTTLDGLDVKLTESVNNINCVESILFFSKFISNRLGYNNAVYHQTEAYGSRKTDGPSVEHQVDLSLRRLLAQEFFGTLNDLLVAYVPNTAEDWPDDEVESFSPFEHW